VQHRMFKQQWQQVQQSAVVHNFFWVHHTAVCLASGMCLSSCKAIWAQV
jgi:hypothetical protein